MGHEIKSKLFSHLAKPEVISYLFIKQCFLLAGGVMALINGGRTNTLSANVHGAGNWWLCANIELWKMGKQQEQEEFRCSADLQPWWFFGKGVKNKLRSPSDNYHSGGVGGQT